MRIPSFLYHLSHSMTMMSGANAYGSGSKSAFKPNSPTKKTTGWEFAMGSAPTVHSGYVDPAAAGFSFGAVTIPSSATTPTAAANGPDESKVEAEVDGHPNFTFKDDVASKSASRPNSPTKKTTGFSFGNSKPARLGVTTPVEQRSLAMGSAPTVHSGYVDPPAGLLSESTPRAQGSPDRAAASFTTPIPNAAPTTDNTHLLPRGTSSATQSVRRQRPTSSGKRPKVKKGTIQRHHSRANMSEQEILERTRESKRNSARKKSAHYKELKAKEARGLLTSPEEKLHGVMRRYAASEDRRQEQENRRQEQEAMRQQVDRDYINQLMMQMQQMQQMGIQSPRRTGQEQQANESDDDSASETDEEYHS